MWNPEIARGDMSVIEELCTKDISAVKKVYKGSEIVILYNINTEPANISLKSGSYRFKYQGYLSVDGNAVTMSEAWYQCLSIQLLY